MFKDLQWIILLPLYLSILLKVSHFEGDFLLFKDIVISYIMILVLILSILRLYLFILYFIRIFFMGLGQT